MAAIVNGAQFGAKSLTMSADIDQVLSLQFFPCIESESVISLLCSVMSSGSSVDHLTLHLSALHREKEGMVGGVILVTSTSLFIPAGDCLICSIVVV